MIKTELCNLLGIKYPIIQAGMGPFGTNKLSIAAANAGVLGLVSSSGIASRDTQPGIYKHFIETGGASVEDDQQTALKKKSFDKRWKGRATSAGSLASTCSCPRR